MAKLRIGTRGSPLALAQAHETRDRLCVAHGFDPSDIEIVVISTTGDRIKDRPLAEIGGKGLFTKEIEEAMIAGDIAIAVHSMKDMPAHLPEGLEIAAFLPREDPRDAFISKVAGSIQDLAHGALLGSSSVRRTAQVLRLRPDLKSVAFRGNVATRLQKLDDGVAHATFLACAGLNRLGLSHHITMPVPMAVMLPAVAQGTIGLEIRSNDDTARKLVRAINHTETEIAIACERAFLITLEGSCQTPIAGHAHLAGGQLHFIGHTLSLDGKDCIETTRIGPTSDAARMGEDAGQEIKVRGGGAIARP
jgi:hydroxymethylbilane synthase